MAECWRKKLFYLKPPRAWKHHKEYRKDNVSNPAVISFLLSYPLLGLRFSLTDGGLPRLLRLHTRLRRVQSRFHTRPLLSGSQAGRHRVVLGAVLQLNTNYSCLAKTKRYRVRRRKMNRTEEEENMAWWWEVAVTKVPTVSVCELTAACTPLVTGISFWDQLLCKHNQTPITLR